jgi:pyridoxal phosphate enzyme (YggS family)
VAGLAQSTSDIGERLAAARARMHTAAERAGRDASLIRLVAVAKTVDAARVAEAVACGVRDIGENRVQEAAAKSAALPADLRWHMLGHLQTNKAARAATLFDLVHSVDSPRVAEALSARRPQDVAPLDVLVEVELTGFAGHTGVPPEALDDLARTIVALPRLRLRGLMTMAPPADDAEATRPTFAHLRRMRDELSGRLGIDLPELSMGMSDDFEVAVEEGATLVRLGRALFGERPVR